MTRRPKHPDKDIERLLCALESAGWDVEKGRKYFKALCPCGTHQKWVHLTPSSSSYLKNLTGWLRRNTCWKEGEP
ncbi:hypothetical protein [Pseudonocardia acaciae]|uniref:hypothetical protein n=1 Tax=Pseudonocardia acaciae TaxID=551276 RepID=UPI000A70965A|nr:hypothetical protein [Pseudonocardia acaciae]